ncbi:SPOR domain-containing protein [Microbulbifer sp. 2201CG32-9]|uniref:SPOR domain-containing protein n=1 Tax=Microbulbifer sp. 2201CG32-9 TaxID=3232309 RepID=UPI00345BC0A2
MRWIVLLLFLVNVGLFAWFQTLGQSVDTPAVRPPPKEAQGERIQLLSEVPANSLAAVAPPPQQAEPELAEDQLCTILGPFGEAYQGEDIVQRLGALEVTAQLRNIEMQGQMRYWVYLAPMGSRREALHKLRQLQAEGIDSYVIPKGSLSNGISFGIFAERGRAASLVDDLRGRGIDVLMREEPQTYAELWLVIPPGGSGQLAEEFWQQLQLEYPQLSLRQNLCDEVRSGHRGPEQSAGG